MEQFIRNILWSYSIKICPIRGLLCSAYIQIAQLHSIITLTINGASRHYVTICTARIFFKKAYKKAKLASLLRPCILEICTNQFCLQNKAICCPHYTVCYCFLVKMATHVLSGDEPRLSGNDADCQHSVMLTSYLPYIFSIFFS